MTDNDQLLEKIGKLIDTKLDEKLEPIKHDMATWREVASVKKDVQAVKQAQAQTNTILAQNKTVLETLLAGQKDIRENMATKADMQDLQAKVVKRLNMHDERLEIIENELKLPHPHKH